MLKTWKRMKRMPIRIVNSTYPGSIFIYAYPRAGKITFTIKKSCIITATTLTNFFYGPQHLEGNYTFIMNL